MRARLEINETEAETSGKMCEAVAKKVWEAPSSTEYKFVSEITDALSPITHPDQLAERVYLNTVLRAGSENNLSPVKR